MFIFNLVDQQLTAVNIDGIVEKLYEITSATYNTPVPEISIKAEITEMKFLLAFFLLGTCVNGGRVFREDEHFTCDDGCNGCTCHSTTEMMCYLQEPPEVHVSMEEEFSEMTNISHDDDDVMDVPATLPLMMCYMQEPPELCKGYKEQKRNTLREILEE
ncbi:unnamed protein product [Mytilus edulis]|uniref:Uncharacterized protein n=1 Tax=Mytilus edulis TaxID=6550 RepID=A0A8S3PRY1_MYTED|nr:unnamed protein product [Mytilus edulis]